MLIISLNDIFSWHHNFQKVIILQVTNQDQIIGEKNSASIPRFLQEDAQSYYYLAMIVYHH